VDVNDPYKPPSAVDADDPYKPPAAEAAKPLGSLAQSARGKELGQARTVLIVVGVLTLAANAFMMYNIPNEVQSVVRENDVDPAQLEQFKQTVSMFCYLIYGGAVLLGVLFIVFGVIVKKYPVPITITSLVLYILATLLFGLLEPMSLARGFIVKILIVVGLFRAIKAARAYESHTKKTPVAGELLA